MTRRLAQRMPDMGLLTPGIGDGDPDDRAIVRAMVAAEAAWATVRGAGEEVEDYSAWLARDDAAADALTRRIAAAAATSGTPIIELVAALREKCPVSVDVIHTGLTSQDVIDTALMLMSREVAAQIDRALSAVVASFAEIAHEHRDTPALAHTLGQAALVTTLGARAATWLHGVAEARERLAALTFPVAFGGASGTLDAASFTDIEAWAARLELSVPAAPWHVARYPVLRVASAFAEVIAALGAFAADVLEGTRPERGELREGHGELRGQVHGGSSSMPFKRNPAGAILVRRGAIAAPAALATVHAAAGAAVDERPDGAWQAEWDALRDLARLALVGATYGASVAASLEVDAEALARNVAAFGHGDGTGRAAEFVDRTLARYARGDA
jgi:3-carboxy-cis,cis-muconate cycloisomerase